MDDDKKLPQGLDDSFEEHELDLNTPEDLNAIEDVTFSDTQTESMAIFDEFDDSNDFADFDKAPEVSAGTSAADTAFENDFSLDTPAVPETLEDEELFQDMESSFEPTTNDSFATDEEMFSSDAFEDVNSEGADFPEGEASKNLGDSQLFDYDPSAETTTEDLEVEDLYANAPGVAQLEGKSKKEGGGNLPGMMKNRRVVRVVVLVVLVGAVYGGLRFFMGGNSNTMTNVASAPQTTHPAPITDMTPAPVAAAPENATPETATAAPENTTPALGTPPAVSTTTTTTEVAAAPEVTPAPASGATSGTTTAMIPAAPVTQTPAVSQGPQTTMQVPAPGTTVTTSTSTTTAAPANQDQIANKLNSLEASIHAIDDRLSHMSQGGTEGTPVKGSHAASPGNAFGTPPPPESSEVLREALHKIDGIDKKMSYLAELENQVHILNKEVNALKSDVVQQSMIVGQNQAHINQNMAANLDANIPKMIVQAAIPGRAWLRSESGQLLTVIPGDEVAGYGRVVSIDPTTGTVVMSSRAIFREQ